jgi:hypothetical protein
MRTEHMTGKVVGTCQGALDATLEVEIVYTYDNGDPTHKAKYSGTLTCDANGKAVRISWNNGDRYTRVQ